ncbi:MAG TPA: PfkB family carbohydrate kinase [Streptosporangiaceae bacterium]|nr:PfkB family carbohydrate kinase [Streptosporangiaceae bacterium]
MIADAWRPGRLILVGSVIADVMMRVPGLPVRGGDVLASAAVLQAGGGFNVLAAARRLGMPCSLAGRVGTGPFGTVIADALAREDVPILMPRPAADSGFCVGFVEPDGERTFATSPGTEAELTPADLGHVDPEPGSAVYVSGYDLCYPGSGPAIAAWCGELGDVLLVLDPGPLAGEIPDAVLAPVLGRTSLLTLNAREAGLLPGTSRPEPGAAPLAPDALVVVRDGPRGCTLYGGSGEIHLPAPAVTVVDSTGAGDAHTGALLAELRLTGDPVSAARVANAAAAFAVTRSGSATGPDRRQLEEFTARLPGSPGAAS